jgi:hypothetical protein
MNYEITYFSNFRDTHVAVYETVTWEELVMTFSEHTITEVKDDIMFNLCSFLDRDGSRCTDNVDSYYGLILDYDGNGATLEQYIAKFAEFTHLGYTSFNHKVKGVDKFRIVFPFATPCPRAEWELRKECFLDFADKLVVDRSCVSHSRSFYVPACSAENAAFKDSWHVDGATLDWTWFTPPQKPVYVAPTVVKPTSITDLQKALDELQRHIPTMDNDYRYWIVRAVAKEVGELQAIAECQARWPDAQWNGKYVDQVKKLKENGPGMGSIINEIRKYNPLYMKDKVFKREIMQQEYQVQLNELEKLAEIIKQRIQNGK